MIKLSTVVDILIIVFLLLGTYAGWRKGLIKSLVNFIGLIAVVILSFYLKTFIANFLIDTMPFLNFAGLNGLSSVNILIYNIISFIFVFIILYCVLNIIISITGFIDMLLKFTVIWIIPSKILGALVGLLESWVYLYLVLFILSAFNVTSSFILGSKVATFMLDETPIVNSVFEGTISTIKSIYKNVEEFEKDETKTTEDLNLRILQIEITNGLITKEKAQELIDSGKINLGNVMFGKEADLWLNI